jgi:hypothetical protein
MIRLKKQTGFINFDFILPLAIFGVIGFIAAIAAGIYGLWWLTHHIAFI